MRGGLFYALAILYSLAVVLVAVTVGNYWLLASGLLLALGTVLGFHAWMWVIVSLMSESGALKILLFGAGSLLSIWLAIMLPIWKPVLNLG